MAPSAHKPRILMLHGGGVSASIFAIQTRKVLWRLGSHFDFVFVDGPFASPPGPGVLPVFADAGPYYRWNRLHHNEDPNKLQDRLRETLTQPGGEWVGVMGFSQGGRLATGLCWEQEHGKEGLDELLPEMRFKFAVLIGSAWPVLLLTQDITPSGQKENALWDEKYASSINIPSVHMIGKQDHVADMSRLTVKCFNQAKAKILEPNIGHHMPLDEGENGELCDAILDAYRRGGGIIHESTA